MAVTRKYHVKIRPLKLELGVDDFNKENQELRNVKVVTIKMKWKGEPKFGLVTFHKHKKDFTSRRIMKFNSIGWDNEADEFENVCCFTHVSECCQSLKYLPWNVSLNVLYTTSLEISSAKMVAIGKVVVNVAELAERMMSAVEEKIPITLNIGTTSISAALHVSSICFCFLKK